MPNANFRPSGRNFAFSLTLGKHLARRDLSRHQRHAPTGWAGSPQVGRFAATGEALSPLGEWSVGAEP